MCRWGGGGHFLRLTPVIPGCKPENYDSHSRNNLDDSTTAAFPTKRSPAPTLKPFLALISQVPTGLRLFPRCKCIRQRERNKKTPLLTHHSVPGTCSECTHTHTHTRGGGGGGKGEDGYDSSNTGVEGKKPDGCVVRLVESPVFC